VPRNLEISEPTWHRWRRQYGGMKADGAKRLRELETENARLKKLLAEEELDKAMLNELAEETSDPGSSPPRGRPVAAAVRGVPAAGLPHRPAAPFHPRPRGGRPRPRSCYAAGYGDRSGASAVEYPAPGSSDGGSRRTTRHPVAARCRAALPFGAAALGRL
jgi:hypothetical protein